MSFRVRGLPVAPFRPLFGLSEAELAAQGILRYRVEEPNAFPCRIGLRDGEPGETALLLHYEHQPAPTPFRASHAIYVSEQATETFDRVDEVPSALRRRTLSVRAFDAAGMMVDADLTDGSELEALAERLLARPDTAYLQAHFARRGCYAARIDRA